ncbi:MAG: hypothetical protein BBJ57_06670 [Desulfobacterales bacterium PC51MH44]|nr:MAG: hypothetical protein BBJ57_06670 [Desulfobacterales bacterium PC51MH44]
MRTGETGGGSIGKVVSLFETKLPFLTNKELSMIFTPPGTEDPIKITAKIVGTDLNGIGVRFDDLLPDT